MLPLQPIRQLRVRQFSTHGPPPADGYTSEKVRFHSSRSDLPRRVPECGTVPVMGAHLGRSGSPSAALARPRLRFTHGLHHLPGNLGRPDRLFGIAVPSQRRLVEGVFGRPVSCRLDRPPLSCGCCAVTLSGVTPDRQPATWCPTDPVFGGTNACRSPDHQASGKARCIPFWNMRATLINTVDQSATAKMMPASIARTTCSVPWAV